MLLFDWLTKTRRRVVVFCVSWTLVSFLLVPLLPQWAQLTIYFAVYTFFVFGTGIIAERKQGKLDVALITRELKRIEQIIRESDARKKGLN